MILFKYMEMIKKIFTDIKSKGIYLMIKFHKNLFINLIKEQFNLKKFLSIIILIEIFKKFNCRRKFQN